MSRHSALADRTQSEWILSPAGTDWTLTRIRDRALDKAIIACVKPGDRVLDLGCGTGELLIKLKKEKQVIEKGVEIDGTAVTEAISRGLSVVHGDLTEALLYQGAGSYDVVILNQVITTVTDPVAILKEAVRVGKRVIITFPNFGHWKNRFQILLSGRLPVTSSLPYQWFDTPNIRLVTVKDFRALVRLLNLRIEREEFVALDMDGSVRYVKALANQRASSALVLLSR